MKRRSDNRMFFNLTVVIVFLFTLLLSCVDVFAAAPKVRAYDATDMEISFNENNYALNAGSVTFVLDRDALLPGQFYVYEDGGLLTSVNDFRYVMEAGEDGEIKFVNFYIKKGDELKSISDSPYFVEFADAIRISPDVTYTDNGNAPVLSVGTRPWVHTYLLTGTGAEKKEKLITGKTDVSFTDDGVYRVSVYTMDGLGNKTFSKKIPEEIVVDKKPPVITSVDTDIESADEEGTVFRKAVTLSAKAWDERSDIQGIYWEASKDEVKADNLTVNAPFKGSISVYARDSAGNTSEKLELFRELIVDDEPPVVSFSQKTEENGILKLSVSAKDSLSGTKKITTKLDGKVISTKQGAKDEVSIDLSSSGYEDRKVLIYAEDLAGNSAEGSLTIKKGDTTPPVIRIYGVSDRGVYGNDVDVLIDARDDSGSLGSYSANILVKDASGKMIFSRSTDSRNLKVTQSGIITVTVTATDHDGNSASSSVRFIVDRDAPVINDLKQYDGKEFEEFFLKEEPEDLIEDLSSVTYDVYLNGLEYDGREVVQAGDYVLKIIATDEFGRRSESRADFSVKKEEEKEEPAMAQILENEIPKKPAAASDRVSGNRAAEPAAISQNALSDNDISGNAVSGDSLSQNTASSDKTAQDPPKEEGFFERLRCGILKLLGIDH